MDFADACFDDTKELLAVSSITNEIKASVHSYLLAASPRSGAVTPNSHSRPHAVLSPWNGCVGASLDSYSPRTPCVTPPSGTSPDLPPGIMLPQTTPVRFPMHCNLSPTRNRFHSPKATAVTDDSPLVFDVKAIPDLEDDVGRTSSLPTSTSMLLPEARVEVDSLMSSHIHGVFGTGSGSVPERLNLYTGFQLAFSSSKPPRPPRHSMKLSGKVQPGLLKGKGKLQQGVHELTDNITVSVISFLLLVLFMVLFVYGGPVK